MPLRRADSLATPRITPPPRGDYRFFALDVETANRGRGSICQIGIACVTHDGRIDGWSTLIDPQTEDWSCSFVHGITGKHVRGAPRFWQVFPYLERYFGTKLLFQHSGFDRNAINAACGEAGIEPPEWRWTDSLGVARRAFPELKGNGGHGLASLKKHLVLEFRHHDAEEDARASALVVLHAEARTGALVTG